MITIAMFVISICVCMFLAIIGFIFAVVVGIATWIGNKLKLSNNKNKCEEPARSPGKTKEIIDATLPGYYIVTRINGIWTDVKYESDRNLGIAYLAKYRSEHKGCIALLQQR